MNVGVWDARRHTNLNEFYDKAVALALRIVEARRHNGMTVLWVGVTSTMNSQRQYRSVWSLLDKTRPTTNSLLYGYQMILKSVAQQHKIDFIDVFDISMDSQGQYDGVHFDPETMHEMMRYVFALWDM
eukprot:PhF_6_TR37648/c0_g1_i1/m.56015